MIPSMSRPANPYDNASCESFLKTLKREEIYANQYRDLDHLRANIEEFIDRYYNQQRLHSALGYRSPEEFERHANHADPRTQLCSPSLEFFPGSEEKTSTRMLEQGTHWFLMDAAKASYAEVGITAALRGVRVSEVMSRDCAIVSPRMSLQEFVDSLLLRAGGGVSRWRTRVTSWASLRPAMWAASRATVGTRPRCAKPCVHCMSCTSSLPTRQFWMR